MKNMIIFIVLLGTLVSCFAAENIDKNIDKSMVSNIKNDEFVVFFRTAAWLSEDHNYWHMPIHGWVYEPEDSTVRKGLMAKTLNLKFGLQTNKSTEANFDRRVNLLIADNERNKRIVVRIGEQQYVLPPSAENGHFKDVIRIPANELGKIANNSYVNFSAVMKPGDERSFVGETRLVAPTGLSIISDIDDTIKITEVTQLEKLFENTFYKDFAEAPGMAPFYNSWPADATLHFVSSSPWQLYSPLLEFAQQSGFPWATFSLKLVRFRDETLLNLFKKGTETKPAQIEPILKRFPKRKFILIGDSGEQDPEVYASIMRKYSGQILKIFIRNVDGSSADDGRYRQAFNGISINQWQLFTDPTTLKVAEFVSK